MIDIRDLTYSYYPRHPRPALKGLTATLTPGIYLLLGENGAGKTTLLKVLAGLLAPQTGTVEAYGYTPAAHAPAFLSRMFFLPDSITIPFRTIREFAEVHSRFYPAYSEELFAEILREFGLEGTERYDRLSLGLKRKSILAYAMALGVDLLLLDEPANGLDITSKRVLRQALARCMAPEATAIVSTHTISDLKELYDGVIILSKGELLLAARADEIESRLTFRQSNVPPKRALYKEPMAGGYACILPVGEEPEPGSHPMETSYALLYSALMSPSRNEILNLFR